MNWNQLNFEEHEEVIAMIEAGAAHCGCSPRELWLRFHKWMSQTHETAHFTKAQLSEQVIESILEIFREWPLDSQYVASAMSKICAEEKISRSALCLRGLSRTDTGNRVVIIESPNRRFEVEYEEGRHHLRFVRYSFTPLEAAEPGYRPPG